MSEFQTRQGVLALRPRSLLVAATGVTLLVLLQAHISAPAALLTPALKELRALSPFEHALLWAPPLVYVIFVKACRAALSHSPRLKSAVLEARNAHNIVAAVGSFAFTAASVYALAQVPRLSPYGTLCTPRAPAPVMVATWYASKLYEWVDSILLLASGKELSSLHYNHHMTTATVVAAHFVGRTVRTSIFDVPLFLNAFVHTLMYSYYHNPLRLRPIKRWLTRMQIVQHVTVLAAIVYTSGTVALGGECDVSPLGNGLSLVLYAMYLLQFLSFYVVAYARKPASKPAEREA